MTKKLDIVAGSANVFLDLGFPDAEARNLLLQADLIVCKRRARTTEKQLLARDAQRDVAADLLLSVQQMNQAKAKWWLVSMGRRLL